MAVQTTSSSANFVLRLSFFSSVELSERLDVASRCCRVQETVATLRVRDRLSDERGLRRRGAQGRHSGPPDCQYMLIHEDSTALHTCSRNLTLNAPTPTHYEPNAADPETTNVTTLVLPTAVLRVIC